MSKNKEEHRRRRVLKKTVTALGTLIAIGLIGFGLFKLVSSQPQISESDIISKSGIHWHPQLAIYIKNKPQEIPANIGIGITHETIHTHDTTGTLHLEFPGFATKNDIKLGRFFKIWGKQFNSNCIFDYCNQDDGKVKFSVNGKENSDLENYLMHDQDRIEIRYE